MKTSEFYEKYWKIKNADGTLSDPKPLTQSEKDSLDEAMSSPIIVSHMRIERNNPRETIDIDIDDLVEGMKKLPPFLKQ